MAAVALTLALLLAPAHQQSYLTPANSAAQCKSNEYFDSTELGCLQC